MLIHRRRARCSNLACSGAAAYYEVTIAGAGHGGACAPGPCVYSARYMVVPVPAAVGSAAGGDFLSVTALGTATGVVVVAGPAGREHVGGVGGVLKLQLAKAGHTREIVVDVRRAGKPCQPAHVAMVN